MATTFCDENRMCFFNISHLQEDKKSPMYSLYTAWGSNSEVALQSSEHHKEIELAQVSLAPTCPFSIPKECLETNYIFRD